MAEQQVDFRRTRGFGDNLNDTFLFIRQNLEPLLKSFFAICGIFILAQAIFAGILQSQFAGIWQTIFSGRRRYDPNFNNPLFSSTSYYLSILLQFLSFASLQVAVGAYIKYYVQNNGVKPGIEDVWMIFKKYFLRVALYMIPIALTIIIGFVLCLLPGIYLWTVLVPFTMVIMMEDADLPETYSRCFYLIKDNFWASLGLYIVIIIIYYLCVLFISLVVGAITAVIGYLTTKSFTTSFGIVTSVLNIFAYSFYVILLVSIALQYFNLVEEKDGQGILGRIENIGGTKNDFENIDEQY